MRCLKLIINSEIKKCNLCIRKCNVNRDVNLGVCQADNHLKVARAQLHFWEEPCVSGKNGSGTVFFSHCNLKCVFCQNHLISQEFNGKTISVERLAEIFLELEKQGANNIVDFLGCDKRIYPVGRLDKDSEGLLLMTNDGELMNNILTGKNEHEKEYIVEVDKNLSDDFERRMSEPMYLKELDKTTRPCRVIKAGKKTFRIILKQGLNRQIRRMCSNLGYKVVKLKRIRIMNIELNDLPAGATRKIEGSEYEKLMNLINKK